MLQTLYSGFDYCEAETLLENNKKQFKPIDFIANLKRYSVEQHIDNDLVNQYQIRYITYERLVATELLDKQQILDFFTNDVDYCFASDIILQTVKNDDVEIISKIQNPINEFTESLKQQVVNIISFMLDNKPNQLTQKFFDLAVKTFKNLEYKLKIIGCIYNNKQQSMLPQQNAILLPYNPTTHILELEYQYSTIPKYHPLFDKDNQCEFYQSTISNQILKGMFLMHEINHLLCIHLELRTPPKIEIQTFQTSLFEEKWQAEKNHHTSEEVRNIYGLIMYKNIIFVNTIYSDTLFLANFGFPLRWGHLNSFFRGNKMFYSCVQSVQNQQYYEEYKAQIQGLYQNQLGPQLIDEAKIKLLFDLLSIDQQQYEESLQKDDQKLRNEYQNQDQLTITQQPIHTASLWEKIQCIHGVKQKYEFKVTKKMYDDFQDETTLQKGKLLFDLGAKTVTWEREQIPFIIEGPQRTNIVINLIKSQIEIKDTYQTHTYMFNKDNSQINIVAFLTRLGFVVVKM
ncbi:Hypothetical_protein [Hexamita inflata]|uniref:Hypothetical_protein n=1 Tax=Hexamita inflata TaxID=28002 RepID=A0AA86QG65_9EUKA|nr:Hypothetical protein HINF_LOCUS40252 [Hexamita inflata]